MMKLGVGEKVVLGMNMDNERVIICAVRVTDGFKVGVGLHQISDLSPLLFDRLTDKVRLKSTVKTLMFAGDIVICSESKE